MARHHRPRILAGAVASAALLLSACGSDDGRPEGLRDIRDTEPATDDDADPDDADKPEADDGDSDPEAPDDREQAGDPEDAESTHDEPIEGVFVSDTAFVLDDELYLDDESQVRHLQFALDAYLYTTRALMTGEWDDAELRRYYAYDELELVSEGLQRYRDEGLRQVNEGTIVEFLRVAEAGGEGVVIHTCVSRGDNDGVIDLATGEFTYQAEDRHRLVELNLELVSLEDGELVTDPDGTEETDYRIVAGGLNAEVDCP